MRGSAGGGGGGEALQEVGEDEREDASGARGGRVGQSVGRPRVCMRMAPQRRWAQVADMAGSQRWPLTSLTISAPASMARRAVAAW